MANQQATILKERRFENSLFQPKKENMKNGKEDFKQTAEAAAEAGNGDTKRPGCR
jgi:hypothetical protein